MTSSRIYFCIVLCLFFVHVGCEPASRSPQFPIRANHNPDLSPFYTRFAPTKIDILPLSELVATSSQKSLLNLYVSLLDAFGSQIKSPGVFRMELYEYVQRSANPRGRRTARWSDIDLTDPSENNKYWNDFLRAYRFELPLDQPGSQDYILQITCLCPNGSRLSSDYIIRSQK